MMTDPIADMLTRLRNASQARHASTTMPASRLKARIAEILVAEGYISGFEVLPEGPQGSIVVRLRYDDQRQPALIGLTRVSKPGLRVYRGHDRIPRVLGGLGTVILSTPKGLMTGRQAWRDGIGGEVLAYVW